MAPLSPPTPIHSSLRRLEVNHTAIPGDVGGGVLPSRVLISPWLEVFLYH